MKNGFPVVFLLVVSLLGCGGSQSSTTSNLVVIGNSITRRPPLASIDWSGDWGMAASSADKDFAHLSASQLGNLPLYATYSIPLEQAAPTAYADIAELASHVNRGSIVVVELGDNVPRNQAGLEAFRPIYQNLLNSVNKGQKMLCLSTFWTNADLNTVIKSECEAHGGQYVFIGDIVSDPSNPDYLTQTFTNVDVQAHPHDWGMARIADRVVAAFRHSN